MTSINQPQKKRQNRTVTLYLGQTVAEYENMISTEAGIQALIRRVETADSLNWGPLAHGHEPDCPRQLHFTHHGDYSRGAKHFDGGRSSVTIIQSFNHSGAVFGVRSGLYHPASIHRPLQAVRYGRHREVHGLAVHHRG